MSETKGRCYNEMKVSRDFPTDHFVMADAIDRLAADVEAIKAKVDRISPDDVRHFVECEKAWVTLVEEQRDAAIRERDEARAEVERLRAELAAPQPAATAAGWLTDEERRVLQNHAESLREQRFALERGGQAVGYSVNPGLLKREADLIDAILARAGSPPVVEVPVMVFGGGSYQMEKRYRAAMDRAGVAWKEVGRG